jgi:DNA helicase-2/ATP-dependent DNA helicase PcrA
MTTKDKASNNLGCIDTLLIRKNEILSDINIYQKKLISLETELLKIEKQMATFSEENIANTLSLSDQQKAIVKSKDKNILVVACPGSGKTHTLISRYINLVTIDKIDPNNIILITFTKKAGMEMNQRISNIIPNKQPYYVGSLHGLGFRLLQQFNNISYTVLDENDAANHLRHSADIVLDKCDDLTEDERCLLRKQIVYIYDKVSTNYPLNLNETINHLSISAKYKTVITNILKEYKLVKKTEDLVDFNDLMIQFCQLLGTKKIADFLKNIKYIFFDEYQDINPVQNYILGCFKQNSNIMVVGDDAQAIYAFRGSSIKYIWEFERNFDDVKTYYLETNYRSTPSIVNFFQDIISHNTNQFKKNVKSSQIENGMKPYIICHNNSMEQYKWVANDIANKRESGVPLRNMVVLSRKNCSLDDLERELLVYSIPIIKSIGISLLNKQHIKDFIAFLIILTNPKSSIHWKRILALHKNIGMTKANEIIESSQQKVESTIIDIIKNNNNLESLYVFIKSCNISKIKDTIYKIEDYLNNLWSQNKEKNIETRIKDIEAFREFIFMKIKEYKTIDDIINNIHLNLEIDCYDDNLFLSTVHGSKGLEWEYVYIIDMDCKNFPNIRQSYYKEEMDNVMEERRLFYVAASRARKYLCINFTQDVQNDIVISPFIRELDQINYIGSNLINKNIIEGSFQLTGNISIDINNYLRFNGYKLLADSINDIPTTRENMFIKSIEFPGSITLKNRYVAGTMIDCLIMKMLHNNYSNTIDNFDLPQSHHNKLPEQIYHNYIDKYTDWRNILNDIFYISTLKKNDIEHWKDVLTTSLNYYNNLEKSLLKLIKNPEKIRIHTNINASPLKGEIDFMVDDTLYEIKMTPDDAATFPNLCQSLMYAYLLNKKKIIVNKVVILNAWDGSIDTFDISSFNLKKFKKILYNV